MVRVALTSVLLLAALPAHAQRAESGPRRAALVELYTSEGCSSCPPAEDWLRAQAAALEAAGAVILELHVDYWDELGWPDAYANPSYTARQRALARRSGGAIYTPELAINGRESSRTLAAIHAEPASVALTLAAAREAERVSIELRRTTTRAATRSYVAIVESGIVVDVRRGENAGRRLDHNRVVRALLGPYAEDAVTLRVPLAPGWRPARLGLVAFVEDAASGEVLQAVALPHLD